MEKIILIFVLVFSFSSCKQYRDRHRGSVYIYRTLPDNYKICVFGDSGFNSSAQYLVASALEKEGCDQIRHTGDVIYQLGLISVKDKQFWTKFYHPYKNLIERQGLNFHMVLGNHDYYLNPTVWLKLARKYHFIKFPSMYHAEKFGDICFINLDTNSDDQLEDQKYWLDNQIKESFFECKIIVSQGHHPYLSSGSHGNGVGEVKKFFEENINGYAHLTISGHDHVQSDEGLVEGTRHLVTGAAGKVEALGRTPNVWGKDRLGYLVLIVKRDEMNVSIDYEFRTVNSDSSTNTDHTGSVKGF
jgi:tartrate-resistant acid phosphatase type 5